MLVEQNGLEYGYGWKSHLNLFNKIIDPGNFEFVTATAPFTIATPPFSTTVNHLGNTA